MTTMRRVLIAKTALYVTTNTGSGGVFWAVSDGSFDNVMWRVLPATRDLYEGTVVGRREDVAVLYDPDVVYVIQ